jgi:TonB family protein
VESAKEKQYSSLPLILTTAGAIVAFSGIGWFYLESQSPELIADDTIVAESPISAALPAVAIPDTDAEPENAEVRATRASVDGPPIDVESELRKARLAASAEMLVAPPQQNALYFYARVLSVQPRHDAAKQELDAILSRVSLQVSDHLSSGDFDDAFALASLVEIASPDHPLVTMTRNTLNERAADLIETARQNAEAGNDGAAAEAFAEAQALPGLDANFRSRAQASIAASRQSRLETEREQVEAERLASEQATTEWATRVRGAIKSGRLLSPEGDSARDYLAEYDAPAESKTKLSDELLEALLFAGQLSTENGDIADAEAYINAASGLRADADGIEAMREELERRIIAAEQSRVLALSDFVRINTEPARYPRLATQLNTTGWVDVIFTVTATGQTADIEVIQAQPESIFNRAAVEAVERWTFQPREFRGQLIDQRAAARLAFRLQ